MYVPTFQRFPKWSLPSALLITNMSQPLSLQFGFKALTPSLIRLKPMINSGGLAVKPKTTDPKTQVQCLHSRDKEHGDLLIHSFWTCATDIIVNVCVADTYAKSYRSKDPHKVLAQQEKEKECKYLALCTTQHHTHFTPFTVSMDGLDGHKASEFLQWLLLCLANKWL